MKMAERVEKLLKISQKNKLYLIDQFQLNMLKKIMHLLISDHKFVGDEKRDAGEALEAIIRVVEDVEVPEGGVK